MGEKSREMSNKVSSFLLLKGEREVNSMCVSVCGDS